MVFLFRVIFQRVNCPKSKVNSLLFAISANNRKTLATARKSIMVFFIFILFPRLSSIVLFAQHLAIHCSRFYTLMPRCYVIGFHSFKFKSFFTPNAFAFLFFKNFSFCLIVKLTKIQMFFLAGQNIFVNAF